MNAEYKATDLGDIRIDNEVIKNVALKAATDIHGVHKIRKCCARKIWNSLTRGGLSDEVTLEFTDASELKITLKLMVEYNVNIPEIAGIVQENVKKSVEYMTGLTVAEVIVKIIGVRNQRDAGPKEEAEEETKENKDERRG